MQYGSTAELDKLSNIPLKVLKVQSSEHIQAEQNETERLHLSISVFTLLMSYLAMISVVQTIQHRTT
jgi:hypothetical protein